MCNRSLNQTAISLSSCEAEFYAASACARELLGLAELFKELHYKVSVRPEMDSDSARHILQRKGPGGLKHIVIRCLAIQQWVQAKRLSMICEGGVDVVGVVTLLVRVSGKVSSEVTKVPFAELRRLLVTESKLSEYMERKERKKTVKCGNW